MEANSLSVYSCCYPNRNPIIFVKSSVDLQNYCLPFIEILFLYNIVNNPMSLLSNLFHSTLYRSPDYAQNL